MNKIKVVATVKVKGDLEQKIQSLILSGVDAVRFNMYDTTREDARKLIETVRMLNKKLDKGIGVMLEIGGPSIHLGKVGGEAYFKTGDKIRLYANEVSGDSTKASIDYPDLIKEATRDDLININNGSVKLKVYDKGSDCLICEVLKGGTIVDFASVNVKTTAPTHFLKVKDIKDIEFASEMNIDFIELPYVKNSDDVMSVTDMLIGLKNDHTNVISRIECDAALEDLDDIIKMSDGILIDRNNLSMEIPMERIPGIQKIIINKCLRMGKISIASIDMILKNGDVPTRIEVQDIANATLDGIDAIMLDEVMDEEQTYLHTVKTVESILKEVEPSIDYMTMFDNASREENADVTGMIATNVAATANKLKCKAIIAPTITGYTARKISRFRPCCPVIAVSPSMETVTSLALHFGINPVLIDDMNSLDKIIRTSENITKGLINLASGDKIIVTGGYPFKETKNTNFMKIEEI